MASNYLNRWGCKEVCGIRDQQVLMDRAVPLFAGSEIKTVAPLGSGIRILGTKKEVK